MLGTIVNSIGIMVGGFLGSKLKHGLKENYKNTIMDAIALVVIVLGITGGLKSTNIILLITSLVIGSFLGELFQIDNKLNSIAKGLQSKFDSDESSFSQGFITGTLTFCVGAMAIVGSLEAGLLQSYDTLFAKSLIDTIAALVFAATLGIGIAFSSIPVFIYQAAITLLAKNLGSFLTMYVINEIAAVGGVLIIAIGITIMDVKKIKVANMLPAIFIPVIYFIVLNLFSFF